MEAQANTREVLESKYRTAVVLGVAMVLSVVVYAVVVEVLVSRVEAFSAPLPIEGMDTIRYGFIAIAIIEALVIGQVRKAMLGGFGSGRVLVGSSECIERIFKAQVVSLALCDTIALYGMVLFLISASVWDFYLFALISMAAFAAYFPRRSRWKQWAGLL